MINVTALVLKTDYEQFLTSLDIIPDSNKKMFQKTLVGDMSDYYEINLSLSTPLLLFQFARDFGLQKGLNINAEIKEMEVNLTENSNPLQTSILDYE